VNFAVPEQNLPEVRQYMAKGPLSADVVPPDGQQAPPSGRLIFIDNAVDPSTGTIRLRAQFENADLALWPGQFVNVALTLAVENDALVIPAQALQTGQQGPFVFVVKPDQTVDLRPVTANRSIGGETVIDSGLKPGETVVTDGQLRLTPGARISVKNATAPKAVS
jgi:multidrug efflux system membrane fusion protein